MKLLDTLKKQGGSTLIKNYFKNGVIPIAIGQIILLGKSRTALEILRLSAELKTKKKLKKKYAGYLDEFDNQYIKSSTNDVSNKIWLCWFQGIENAPMIVKKCYESIRQNLYEHEIILITEENLFDYVEFPEYIIDKWKHGIISNTHMTDILRLELLTKYGGTWIDATVLCTKREEDIPNYIFESDLFFYQTLKPGRDGCSTYMSSWFISAKKNNKILEATKYLCYKYWEKNNSLIDYFLLHQFMSIVLEYYEDEWRKIVPVDNATPHILLLRLFEQYDSKMWMAIINQTAFHKLSYKFSETQKQAKGTFYKKILGEY